MLILLIVLFLLLGGGGFYSTGYARTGGFSLSGLALLLIILYLLKVI